MRPRRGSTWAGGGPTPARAWRRAADVRGTGRAPGALLRAHPESSSCSHHRAPRAWVHNPGRWLGSRCRGSAAANRPLCVLVAGSFCLNKPRFLGGTGKPKKCRAASCLLRCTACARPVWERGELRGCLAAGQTKPVPVHVDAHRGVGDWRCKPQAPAQLPALPLLRASCRKSKSKAPRVPWARKPRAGPCRKALLERDKFRWPRWRDKGTLGRCSTFTLAKSSSLERKKSIDEFCGVCCGFRGDRHHRGQPQLQLGSHPGHWQLLAPA